MFDENVTMKLELNMEMSSQDEKVWARHSKLMAEQSMSNMNVLSSDGLEYQIEELSKVIEHLNARTVYNSEKYNHEMHH
jgi:hypothetical protein